MQNLFVQLSQAFFETLSEQSYKVERILYLCEALHYVKEFKQILVAVGTYLSRTYSTYILTPYLLPSRLQAASKLNLFTAAYEVI